MGCDIHPGLFFVREKGWAEFKAVPPNGRHYTFFGVLAGVRGNGPAISEPRGFPNWFGEDPWWSEYITNGDHSASWVTLNELLDYRVQHEGEPELMDAMGMLNNWIALGRFYQQLDDIWRATGDQVVYVFNFDS